MKRVLVACRTLEQELLAAMEKTSCDCRILWLEAGQHNWPDKLRRQIQELLDQCRDCDTVLLAMSLCGNSVVGLQTHDFRLVIPRCDDCITLLLGSLSRRQQIKGAYFLTEGWLRGERNIWEEYTICLARYGEALGKEIFAQMLAHYRQLLLVDTGCFDRKKAETQVKQIAAALGLEYGCLEGTLDYLQRLLTGPWEEASFVVAAPHSCVTAQMCALKG